MSDFNSTNVQLLARIVPRPGCETQVAEAFRELVPTVLQEPGCIFYRAHESSQAPGTIVMYETWASQEALDAHAAGSNFLALTARLDGLLAEPIALEMLRRIS